MFWPWFPSSNTLFLQERKDKLGERIVALQQLVSPYGKVCWEQVKYSKKLIFYIEILG